jgi:hypothetical protein
MKCLALASAMTAAMASLGWAADLPNQQTLNDMGLGGLTIMSDSESMSVRGMGWSPVSASGFGWAIVHVDGASAGSINKYSSKGKHKAWGENDSHAGVIIVGGKGGHGGHGGNDSCNHCGGHGGGNTKAIIAFSGGSSRAGRK